MARQHQLRFTSHALSCVPQVQSTVAVGSFALDDADMKAIHTALKAARLPEGDPYSHERAG